MRTKLKILTVTLILDSLYLGTKECPFIKGNWNNHKITVTNAETQTSFSYEYWASIHTGEIKRKADLVDVLECLISEANLGSQYSYEEYLSEFGLVKGKETLTTFKKLQKISGKLLNCLDLEASQLPEFQQAFFELTGETYV